MNGFFTTHHYNKVICGKYSFLTTFDINDEYEIALCLSVCQNNTMLIKIDETKELYNIEKMKEEIHSDTAKIHKGSLVTADEQTR